MTTDTEHELRNIQNWLASGFDHVVLILGSRTDLYKARRVAKGSIGEHDFTRVHFLTFEEPKEFLVTLKAQTESTETTVRGYRVGTLGLINDVGADGPEGGVGGCASAVPIIHAAADKRPVARSPVHDI